MKRKILIFIVLSFSFLFANTAKTVVVSAEGLADPNADIYKKDRGIMLDDLRKDAKRQLIEKAVGVFVDSYTLVENYIAIEDKVLSRSNGLIKKIIKESPMWVGDDGFAHILMEAEVFIDSVKNSLKELTKAQKISMIKTEGNPRISVNIKIKNSPSIIAENKLKEHIKKFGYTVWSEKGEKSYQKPDFTINGEVKFKTLKHKLKASGITLEKTVLTSWSVNCIDRNSLEEVYFNNKVPKKRSWNSQDEAIEEIGTLIGKEFSADFFMEKLNNPIKTFLVEIEGLPNIEVAQLFKKEFIGLRSILSVNFRTFNSKGVSVYEIDFGGVGKNFAMITEEGVIAPINKKLGKETLKLVAFNGNIFQLSFSQHNKNEDVSKTLQTIPPASLSLASKERLAQVVKSDETQKRLKALSTQENESVMSSIKNF